MADEIKNAIDGLIPDEIKNIAGKETVSQIEDQVIKAVEDNAQPILSDVEKKVEEVAGSGVLEQVEGLLGGLGKN